MAQPSNNDIQLSNQAGPDYRAEHNQINLALASHQQGGTAPSYAISGMTWIDDSSTPWELKLYDGADWIMIGEIDPATNKFQLSSQADGTELSGIPTIAQMQKTSIVSATSGGSNNAYTVILLPVPDSYAENLWVRIKANHSNTGAATLNVNTLGNKTIVDLESNALSGGEILNGGIYDLVYDGTNFILLGSLIYNSGNASSGQVLTADGLGRAQWSLVGSAPTGVINPYAGTAPPSGWLECDGSTISRTTYADLFGIIGTTYGAGDGSTTFNLPDLRGEFIRGWDNGRGIDSSRAFGSSQSDELRQHSHDITVQSGANTNGLTRIKGNNPEGSVSTIQTGSFGGAETRPRNIALMYIIKY